MSLFTTYTTENAPSESKELLQKSEQTYGFLPNVLAVMAEAPATYKAYMETSAAFNNETSFTPLEQQVVYQTANFFNNCHYCVPAHTTMMKKQGMPDDVIQSLREGQTIKNQKLAALQTFTQDVLETQGHLDDKQIQTFLDAGYTKKQALEVTLGLAAKLLSNYVNALAKTAVDEPFKANDWTHPKERSGKVA